MSINHPPRPEPLDVQQDGIPPELKRRETWICWRYEFKEDRGEWTKVPADPNTGSHASSTDPDTWAAFDQALTHHESEANTDGLGFVFAPEDDIVGIDLDHCRDPDTERPDGWVVDVVKRLDSFTEVSPSGTGYHIFGMGEVPDGGNRKGDIEMYDSGRFFTVTGHRVDTSPLTVEDRQGAIEDVHAEHIADDEPAGNASDGFNTAADTGTVDLTDEELLEKARNAGNGEKFRRLYDRGDISAYPSHSEARQALANLLAFWTRGDESKMLNFFRDSALCRGSDDVRTFEKYEIQTALDGRTEFYEPRTVQTAEDDSGVVERFSSACEHYGINPRAVATGRGEDGEKVPLGITSILGNVSDLATAVMTFNRKADRLDGTDRQAVIGHVVREDLEATGEFFQTTGGRLYYFHDDERQVYRADGDGNRVLDEDFEGMVWERYNLFAGRFSRNLGKDIRTKARRHAETKAVYRFAHYDELAGELYVTDWEQGYYAISPGGIEHRPNGTDVYFLQEGYADGYRYIKADVRPDLPAELPGELGPWAGNGDPTMRLFGNRINYDEGATLAPAEQRKQLYLHLHALPFIDLLNARPIMAWVGVKGSGKTVIQRSIGQFVYGEDYTESVMPDALDDFLAKVTNQALAFIDNYDDGEDWANDILAAVATGAGVDKRELYTTNDVRREVPRCWLSITSRDPPFRRDDVADRTLVFRVERIEDDFIGMSDYLQEVSHYRDVLWSAYLDNLQAIVSEHARRDTATMSSAHRMADWAIFARIIADALDVEDVGSLLETMETERATFALENEPWATDLGKWVRANPDEAAEWQPASDLIEAMDAEDGPLRSPSGFGSKMSTYRDELGALFGLKIDRDDSPYQYRFATDGDETTVPTGLNQFE